MYTPTNKQKEAWIKAAIAGGLLSGVTTIMYGNGAISVAGYSLPAMVPLFAAGAGASLITDLVSSQMNMPTTSSQKIADLSSLAVSSGISAGAAFLLLKATVGLPPESTLPIIAYAAGSQAGADYIVHRWLENETGALIF